MIVHTGTTVQSTFLVVDEEGNVVDSKTISAAIPAITDASWADALAGLRQHRDALVPAPVAAPEAAPFVPTEEVNCGS